MIKISGRYNLILDRRFGFIILAGKREELPNYRVWEGPYFIVRKLNGVVYCICESNRSKNKIVHADRLAHFIERKIN